MSMSNTTKRVKEIRRNARRKFSSEEKIRIVLDGLRGESSIAELCSSGKDCGVLGTNSLTVSKPDLSNRPLPPGAVVQCVSTCKMRAGLH